MSTDRDVEQTFSKLEFIAKLRHLADALESDASFAIEVDGEEIAVPSDAVFSVEHEREEGSEELEFQMSWKTEASTGEGGDDESEDDGEAGDEEVEPAEENVTSKEEVKQETAA